MNQSAEKKGGREPNSDALSDYCVLLPERHFSTFVYLILVTNERAM